MIRRRLVKSNRDSIARVVFPLRRLFGSPNNGGCLAPFGRQDRLPQLKGRFLAVGLAAGLALPPWRLQPVRLRARPWLQISPGVPASRAGSYRLNLSDANDLRAHFPASNGPDGMGASGCVLVICLSVWISPQPEVAECTDAAQQR